MSDLGVIVAQIRRAQGLAGENRLPPVEAWNPEVCGDIDLRIRADGAWWHDGVRISREPLVRLFSTILRKDADGVTYLVTPGEKVIVHVEDAPFLAVRVDRAEVGAASALVFTTNVGDVIAAGPAHPIRVATDPVTGAPRPYVLVRGRLEARITRAAFYDLVAMAHEVDGRLIVESGEVSFDLGAVAP